MDNEVTQNDIETHFKQFGEIVEVGYSLNSNGRFYYAQREVELNTKIQKELKKQSMGQVEDNKLMQSLYLKKQKMQDKRKELNQGQSEKQKYNWFYVTFNEVHIKTEVLQIFKKYNHNRIIMNAFFSQETKKKVMIEGQKRMCVSDIDEPNHIYWEN